MSILHLINAEQRADIRTLASFVQEVLDWTEIKDDEDADLQTVIFRLRQWLEDIEEEERRCAA